MKLKVVIFSALAVVLVAAATYFAILEEKRWQDFAINHDCKVIEKVAPSYIHHQNSDGSFGQTYISGRTSYRCNDGVVYERSE